ncbi:MAG: gluconate 2-dehydrogenase subunit 3 family protein [Gammaproteobacteria bacterium]|nr:gluconate 2-dehydrogenase subunit 3 family protein [Gammaproteobacteria bacterium]
MSRRQFLRQGGVGLLAFTVGGCTQEMTPQEARRRGAALQVLSETEVAGLERLGETLLPGSAERGLAQYIDHQLAANPEDSMLMIKYLGVPRPFAPFYSGGLAAASVAAMQLYDTELAKLTDEQSNALAGRIASGELDDWQGPPSPFFYFVLRADAVDVVYGGERGFADLGIPYAAHIAPPSRWGE